MVEDDTTANAGAAPRSSRRAFVKATGVAGVLGVSGAGCLAEEGGSGDGTTVTYGLLNPMTGPYGGLAEGQRNGANLAIQHVNERDEFDVEIEGVEEDTEADPSTGRRKAQSLVEQDGASFLMGAISSSTALALNEYALEEELIYNPGAAAVAITGENCNEYVFRAEHSVAQIAEAVSGYTAENLGTDVWFHIADYAYGESVMERVERRMGRDHEVNVVGRSRSQLGADNYSSYVSQISNSDAEVAILGMTGGDLINFVKQAASQGLKDDVELMSPTLSFAVVRNALGEAAYDTHSALRYAPSFETGTNQDFVSAYQEEYGSPPDNFARVAYQSITMTARGIDEAGSTDPSDVKDELAGMETETVMGDVAFRDCDHQATNAVWSARLVEPDSGDAAAVERTNELSGEESLPDCSDLGCDL